VLGVDGRRFTDEAGFSDGVDSPGKGRGFRAFCQPPAGPQDAYYSHRGDTTGLSFSTGANGSASMSFTGTLTNVNAALGGLTHAPTVAFTGSSTFRILSNDQGATGSGGPMSDTDQVTITVRPSIV
jgi:hypothetical protein